MSYMDGALPFDISDFATTSPKGSDIQSMMNDSYTVPQPVPPVSSSSAMSSNYMNYDPMYSSQMSSSYDQYSQPLSYNGPSQPPSMFPYGQSQPPPPNSFAASNQSGSYMHRPPPPMPPFDNNSADASASEEYNPDTWALDWNPNQESSFNSSLDAPHSPPSYERKGVNTNVIEYIEPNLNDGHMTGAGDVDHRQLILPMNGLSAIGAKDRSRLVDVDHRNLISLTGSPKLNEKDVTAAATGLKDMDFRQMMPGGMPNAPPPPSIGADNKLVPPPSPPVMLLAQSSVDSTDAGNLMSPPTFLPPKFQSPPSQKPKNERGTRTYFNTNSCTMLSITRNTIH